MELSNLKDYSEIPGMINRLTYSYGYECIYKNGKNDKMKGEILEKNYERLDKKSKKKT